MTSWKKRVGLTLSAVWLCLVALTAEPHRSIASTLGAALLPLALLWGIAWIVAGWRAQRQRMTNPSAVERDWPSTLRTAATCTLIVVAGLGTATWWIHHRGLQDYPSPVPYLSGQWFVYSLIAYAVLRFITQLTPRNAVRVTALFFAVAVNIQSYRQVESVTEFRKELAAATPILVRLQAGQRVTAEEIKAAGTGNLAPALAAAASTTARVVTSDRKLERVTTEAGLSEVLTPQMLATPGGRERGRQIIELVRQETATHKLEAESALRAGKVGFSAALSTLPDVYGGMAEGYSTRIDQLLKQLSDAIDLRNQALSTMLEVIATVEHARGPVRYVDKPTPSLLFTAQEDLEAHRAKVAQLSEIARQEYELNRTLMREQSEKIDDLGRALKGPL